MASKNRGKIQDGAQGDATLEPFEGFDGIQEEVTYDAERAAQDLPPWRNAAGDRFYNDNEAEPR